MSQADIKVARTNVRKSKGNEKHVQLKKFWAMTLGKIIHRGHEVHCLAAPKRSTRAQIGEDVEQKGELART